MSKVKRINRKEILEDVIKSAKREVKQTNFSRLLAIKKDRLKADWKTISPLLDNLTEDEAVGLIHELFKNAKDFLGCQTTDNLSFESSYGTTYIVETRLETRDEFDKRCAEIADSKIYDIKERARRASSLKSNKKRKIAKLEAELLKLKS